MAAAADGLQPSRRRAAAAGLPDRDARLPHLRGARRRHGARPGQPGSARGVVRRAGVPVHGAARGDRAYDDVAMPPDTERLDFELEIAAVICRDVRNGLRRGRARRRSAATA